MAPIDRPLYAGVELGGTKCIAILARRPGRDRGPRDGGNDHCPTRRSARSTQSSPAVAGATWIPGPWHRRVSGRSSSIRGRRPSARSPRTPKPGWQGAPVKARLEAAAGVPDRVRHRRQRRGAGRDALGRGAGNRRFRLYHGRHRRRGRADRQWPADAGLRPLRARPYSRGAARRATSSRAPARSTAIALKASPPALRSRREPGAARSNLAPDSPVWDSVAMGAGAVVPRHRLRRRAPRHRHRRRSDRRAAAPARARATAAGRQPQRATCGFPTRQPYVRRAGAGADAGPLGAIALAMSALGPISKGGRRFPADRRRRAVDIRRLRPCRPPDRTVPSSGITQRIRSRRASPSCARA